MMIVNEIKLIEEDVLGPGRRVGVWFQGCSLRCKGCIVPELWKSEGKEYTPEELFSIISSFKIKEVSLSGGEPFEQDKNDLLKFLKLLKENDYGIWVYTGYTLEELIEKNFEELLIFIDVIVDGRYVEELNDGKPWRGSSNQRIILLSERYSNVKVPNKRKIQMEITENEIIIIGIPPKDFLKNLKNNLNHKEILIKF